MSKDWGTYQLEDLDGHWVYVECNGATAEKMGPSETKGQVNTEEAAARMRIRLAHGPGTLSDQ